MLRKQWSSDHMIAAIKSVRSGQSIRAAAKEFNIPRQTLGDRITGKVGENAKSGPSTKLTAEDETRLSDYLIKANKLIAGKSKSIAIMMAGQLAKIRSSPFPRIIPSTKWFRNFFRRHPELSRRKAQPFGRPRANVSSVDVDLFYDNFHETLTKNRSEI